MRLIVGKYGSSFAQDDRLNYSCETYLAIDKIPKTQLSFHICYLIELVRGLVVLLRCSRLLESSFLPCGIENGQLLQYGHAYQLSFLMNVKTCILLRTAERCENGNAMHLNDCANKTECKLFIDRYCM